MIARFPLVMLIGVGIGIAAGMGVDNPGLSTASGGAAGLFAGILLDVAIRLRKRRAATQDQAAGAHNGHGRQKTIGVATPADLDGTEVANGHGRNRNG